MAKHTVYGKTFEGNTFRWNLLAVYMCKGADGWVDNGVKWMEGMTII